jgi:alpha-galactosidase
MGWNSWNTFGKEIHEDVVKQTANTLIDQGLRDLGYRYICIDDFWQGERDSSGRPHPHPDKFPSGMKALGDYLHERGFYFGMYSDAGDRTCGGVFGSLGYEEIDAQTYADWGVDYLKYDYCHAPTDRATAIERYTRMGKALRATGRPIVYSVCEWGDRQPWLWASQAGGHLWRTTGDIWDSWCDGKSGFQYGIEKIGFDLQRGLEQYARPGAWNDLDMLVVGMRGKGNTADGTGCTTEEYRTQFSLWCMLAAPLLIGGDVRQMDAESLGILKQAPLIAINQDALGRQGFRSALRVRTEIYQKPLLFGEVAVAFFNRDHHGTVLASILPVDLGLSGEYQVQELWSGEALGVFSSEAPLTAQPAPHGCRVFRLSPVGR